MESRRSSKRSFDEVFDGDEDYEGSSGLTQPMKKASISKNETPTDEFVFNFVGLSLTDGGTIFKSDQVVWESEEVCKGAEKEKNVLKSTAGPCEGANMVKGNNKRKRMFVFDCCGKEVETHSSDKIGIICQRKVCRSSICYECVGAFDVSNCQQCGHRLV